VPWWKHASSVRERGVEAGMGMAPSGRSTAALLALTHTLRLDTPLRFSTAIGTPPVVALEQTVP
jgi:hypothetical protein